jgi:hypothetical protein
VAIFSEWSEDPKTHKLYGFNGSGRSALGRDLQKLLAELKRCPHIPSNGSLPVTVPGTVDAARWRYYGSAEPTGEAREGVGTVTLETGFSPETRKGSAVATRVS